MEVKYLTDKEEIERRTLKEGVYLTTDLAYWFGISKNYFSQKKEERLEELKFYCDYELVGKRKIHIIKVKQPFYIKQYKEKKYDIDIKDYEWGKAELGKGAEIHKLNEKEKAIKKILMNKYFSSFQDDILFIQMDIDKGAIREEEAWGIFMKKIQKKSFVEFFEEFREKTGYRLVRKVKEKED